MGKTEKITVPKELMLQKSSNKKLTNKQKHIKITISALKIR